MWDKLGAIISLAIGCYLIFFRKSFVCLMTRKQLDERTTPKTKEYRRQLKEMKLEGTSCRILEIAAIAFGVCFVLLSIPELFFPQADRHITYILEFCVLSLFAATAAAIVELITMFRFLWRKVRKYTIERYPDLSRSIEGSFGSDKLNAIRSVPTDDPVLRTLQKRAIIYTVVCFVALFIIFLLAFYTIVRVTG